MQKNIRIKARNSTMPFVDLKNASDSVHTEALGKVDLEDWLVCAVMAMYEGAETVEGDSKVGLHQGSASSPLPFVIVVEVVTKELQVGLSWELM